MPEARAGFRSHSSDGGKPPGVDSDDEDVLRNRRRSESPIEGRVRWASDDEDEASVIEDDIVDQDSYRQFSLAWLADLEPSGRDGASSDVDAASDDRTMSTQDEIKAAAFKGISAYGSHYLGSGEIGGDHGANITVLHDPQNQQRPLFRWL